MWKGKVTPELKKLAAQYAKEHDGYYPDDYIELSCHDMSYEEFLGYIKEALRRHCSMEEVVDLREDCNRAGELGTELFCPIEEQAHALEKYYQTAEYQRLFYYFFDVYLTAVTEGMASSKFAAVRARVPELDCDNNQAVANYLQAGLTLVCQAYYPDLLSLLLEHLEQSCEACSIEQRHMMSLSRRLMVGLHEFDIHVLVAMSPLWTAETKNDWWAFFYAKLPQEIKTSFQIDRLWNTGGSAGELQN